uniref:Uncharacterized protein n=1 Tax=Mus musculus TaxID=10090 RepID=Q8C5A3_MOUSE|nr:unnamed protein product [Mus musculus]
MGLPLQSLGRRRYGACPGRASEMDKAVAAETSEAFQTRPADADPRRPRGCGLRRVLLLLGDRGHLGRSLLDEGRSGFVSGTRAPPKGKTWLRADGRRVRKSRPASLEFLSRDFPICGTVGLDSVSPERLSNLN